MADVIKDYECCTLYRPDMEPEALDQEVEAIRALIAGGGGEIQRIDRWNRRYLAYPIKKYTEGFYVIYRWFGNKNALPQLMYHLRYNEDCMRYLLLDYTEIEAKRRKRRGKGKAAQV